MCPEEACRWQAASQRLPLFLLSSRPTHDTTEKRRRARTADEGSPFGRSEVDRIPGFGRSVHEGRVDPMKPLRNLTAPTTTSPPQPREKPCPEEMISVLIDVVDLENLMVDGALHQIQETPRGERPAE
jgi:hypothetical protein